MSNKPCEFFCDAVKRDLQFLLGILQMLTDGQTLRTMLFTLSAAYTLGCFRNILAESRAHKVFFEAVELTL